MAMTGDAPLQVSRLAAFGLTSADADALANFYARAFGCRRLGARRRSGAAFEALMGVRGGARSLTLGLGGQRIEITQFDTPGSPYPEDAAASDLAFQHFAIVAADMDAAYRRMRATPGWRPISTNGPQRLPVMAGGIAAFKFRDPEGHPLELLAFPEGASPSPWRARPAGEVLLGIDHSALSVSDSARSVRFYQSLGLKMSGYSLNSGPAQDKLDAIADAQVEVTALSPPEATPHVELLGYRGVVRGPERGCRSNDIAASRLLFEAARPFDKIAADLPELGMLDCDGHHLTISIAPRERSPEPRLPAKDPA